jgi:hypothetical protein
MHAQQLVIIQWMDSCIPKEEEEGWKFHRLVHYICPGLPPLMILVAMK